MSLSKSLTLCDMCRSDDGRYACPKCGIRFCSSACYRSPAHEKCSEAFFQQWVTATLKERSYDSADIRRKAMLDVLMRNHQEENEESNEDAPLEDRFADLDLEKDDLDETLLWDKLTDSEKGDFRKLLSDSDALGTLVNVQTPWWSAKKVALVIEPSKEGESCPRPPLPIGVAGLNSLTSKKPSGTVAYNLVNVLYAYVFVTKLYNFAVRDFIEDSVDLLLQLCPVLSLHKCYASLDETVQDSIRMITNTSFQIPFTAAKLLCFDVCSLIDGPSNSRSDCYVLCALGDMRSLIAEAKSVMKSQKKKDEKKILFHAMKKLEYFLSWVIDFYDSDLKLLSSEMQLKYFPEIMTDVCKESAPRENDWSVSQQKKTLIEELG